MHLENMYRCTDINYKPSIDCDSKIKHMHLENTYRCSDININYKPDIDCDSKLKKYAFGKYI